MEASSSGVEQLLTWRLLRLFNRSGMPIMDCTERRGWSVTVMETQRVPMDSPEKKGYILKLLLKMR